MVKWNLLDSRHRRECNTSTVLAVQFIPRTHTSSSTVFHALTSQARLYSNACPPGPILHLAHNTTSTICHSSHVMRHSGYRHFKPSKQCADESNSAGFYIHAFLLFCWFMANIHWAWLWYAERRDARRQWSEARFCLSFCEMLLREGQWEDAVDFSPWPDNLSISERPGIFSVRADWLTGESLVVSLRGISHVVTPSMYRCDGEDCQRQGWHHAASRERYLYHKRSHVGQKIDPRACEVQ